MEIVGHQGAYYGRQHVSARPLAQQVLKWAWLERQYRRLKLRYKVLRGDVVALRARLADTQRKLDMEEMNGMAIMECRNIIEKNLGVNAVAIPGLDIKSPFFDDLVAGVVEAVIQERARADKYKALADMLSGALAQTPYYAAQTQAIAMQQSLLTQTTANTTRNHYIAFTASGAAGSGTWTSLGTSASGGTLVSGSNVYVGRAFDADEMSPYDDIHFLAGHERRVYLPDGARIDIAKNGSYQIIDKDAKVIYRANRIREFNRFINASDILSQFVEFCGKEAAVTKDEMLKLPVHLFIQYLIVEAAKADGEDEPEDIALVPALRKSITCLGCETPLSVERRTKGLHYCGAGCLETHEQRTFEAVAA